MTDIYLAGESKKRKSGRWWAALLLLIGLSGLASYAYLRLEAHNAAREQVRAAIEPGESNNCEWLPLLRARHKGSQICPAGSYVNGVDISYDEASGSPIPSNIGCTVVRLCPQKNRQFFSSATRFPKMFLPGSCTPGPPASGCRITSGMTRAYWYGSTVSGNALGYPSGQRFCSLRQKIFVFLVDPTHLGSA